jgi:PKD repeat protein
MVTSNRKRLSNRADRRKLTRPFASSRSAWALVLLASAALVLAPAAQAGTNVVPNPGFEQGGCGSSMPVICGWGTTDPTASISQDTANPHSGSASMSLDCGNPTGCFPTGGLVSVLASTDPVFCAAIGPGTHPASFWYRTGSASQYVGLSALFYQGSDCSGSSGWDSFYTDPAVDDNAWHQVSGALVAPAGTQSALFALTVGQACDDFCFPGANFDDLDVEDTVDATPTIRSFDPTSGPVGTSVTITGTDFTGATAVAFDGTPAAFTVQSATSIVASVPSGATSGPISVTTPSGTGTSSSPFTVTVAPAPTIGSFTPGSGPVGTSVDILGASFTGASSVTFNGTPASFTVNSDSELHATVPSGATTGPISVATASGTATSASSFTVLPDTPPSAGFTFSCTGLSCSFDGSSSSDPDGTITAYSWDFGDGTSGSGQSVGHSYAQVASYTVTLTVTDNSGATASASQTVTLIHLSARGYKLKGLQKVDLSWSGPSGTSFDLYRNGTKIITVQTTTYTDNIDRRGSGTYTYKVCAPALSSCSNDATISF